MPQAGSLLVTVVLGGIFLGLSVHKVEEGKHSSLRRKNFLDILATITRPFVLLHVCKAGTRRVFLLGFERIVFLLIELFGHCKQIILLQQ